MRIDKILERFEDVEKGNGKYVCVCKCPCHQDKNRDLSMSIATQADGRRCLLMLCHAGCPTGEILEAVGLTREDLIVDEAPAVHGYELKVAMPVRLTRENLIMDAAPAVHGYERPKVSRIPLGALVPALASGSWLRIYDLDGVLTDDQPEPIFDGEADEVFAAEGWQRIRDEDVIRIRAVEDPDTVGPVIEVYI